MQYWPFVTSVNMKPLHSTSANRVFSNLPILTSVDQRTQLTNERFDPTSSCAHCLCLFQFSSSFFMCINYGSLRVY
ncbi:hypothetical protein T4B_2557, partial [Trichinella pseudospiralis]